MHILKTPARDLLSMNHELDGKKSASEPVGEEESTDVGAKALSHTLLNRPSPPF
jgi:hypothetical protein